MLPLLDHQLIIIGASNRLLQRLRRSILQVLAATGANELMLRASMTCHLTPA